MSSRPGAVTSVRKDGITAEVRAFWPTNPDANPDDVFYAIGEAAQQAVNAYYLWREETYGESHRAEEGDNG